MSRLTLSSSKVVAEVIDGEAIILDLRAGSYFATEGAGAVVWSAAVDGHATESIVASASAAFGEAAGADASALLDGFVVAGLLVASDSDDAVPAEAIAWPAAWTTPVLEKHDDLQDMMQLDPIHDTDASGWPMPSPTVPQ